MKLQSQYSEFRSLLLLSVFTTAIVLASSSSIPIQNPGDADKKPSTDSKETFDDGTSLTTPSSDDNQSSENDSQNGDAPPPVQSNSEDNQSDYLPNSNGDSVQNNENNLNNEKPPALESLEPAINPINSEDVETANTFFLPIVVGGYPRYGGGWGYRRPWGGYGGWGGGWRGGWGGRGWGGGWGGRGWGGGFRGGWGGGWRG